MEDRRQEEEANIPLVHGPNTQGSGNTVPSTEYHGNGVTVTGSGDAVTRIALPEWPEGLKPPMVRFLNAFAVGGSISQAGRSCGMSRNSPYRWLESSEVFQQQFEIAKEYGVQRLEDWALARAMDAMTPSDRLTEFLLKAARPEVYRERVDHHLHGKVEHRKRVILESLDEDRIVEALPENAGESSDDA